MLYPMNFLAGHRGIEPLSLDRRSSVLADAPMPRICIPPTGFEPAVLGSTARCDTITPRWDCSLVPPARLERASSGSRPAVLAAGLRGYGF